MAGAVGLRDDFTAKDLRRLAQSRRDAGQVCRLRALAVICDGGSRSEAARIGRVGLQTVRDCVLRFNRNGPDGLIDGKAPGSPAPRCESASGAGGCCREWPHSRGARRRALETGRSRT